jgi:polyisoprenoid-binding protein YceI
MILSEHKLKHERKMKTKKWALDPTHSEIQFKVKHLMISTVTGHFKQFDGWVETAGDDLRTAKVRFTAEINSIDTNNEQRDAHLQNGDFFDAVNHRQLTFISQKLEKIDDENYKLHGNLTMRGTTNLVVLDVEFGGIAKDPWGNTKLGVTVSGKINRKDYGVNFDAVTETGGFVLSNEVKILASVQFVQQEVLQVA